ncbi:MAG TPA: hypothetical protein VK668_10375 [Mucilaginibacter sp.]|nr:hypothetical protein [Mucilaginibacter sp.]
MSQNQQSVQSLWEKADSPLNTDLRQKKKNALTEVAYHKALVKIKLLLQSSNELAYERNLKEHPKGIGGMHCFLTNNFYWFLVCDYCHSFHIHFAFEDCVHEEVISQIIMKLRLGNRVSDIRNSVRPKVSHVFASLLETESPEFFSVIP